MVGQKGICTFTAFASVLQTGELTRAQPTHGGQGEIWTPDTQGFNLVLYQLSYLSLFNI